MAEYVGILKTFPAYAFSLLYTILVSLTVLKNLLTVGPRKLFALTKRDIRPVIIDDESLGVHGFAKLKQLKLHYVAKGSEEKPLMLFLHGFPEFWLSWRFQLKEFGGDYRAVAVDMRGYGESDKPAGITSYTMDKLVEDIRELIPALGYEKCILCAHDWGGAIAFSFARMYPEMVEKLVVCNCPSGPSFSKFLRSNRDQFKKSWYMFFFQMPWLPELLIGMEDFKAFDQMFADLIKKEEAVSPFTDADIQAYKYTFSRPGALTPPLNYYRASMRYKPNIKYPSAKVKVPTMMLWGTEDTALSKDLAHLSGNDVEDYRYHYIEGASHWVQQHKPEVVNNYIRQFLSGDEL